MASGVRRAAEAAGLTRQALYHHFKSKEALFRAVIERLYQSSLVAEIAAADAAEKAGASLAGIVIAQITARLTHLVAALDGSPHVEELFSEHLGQSRDLYQKYASLYAAQGTATIERVCAKQRLGLRMAASELWRCVEMAVNGTKSAYPNMQPVDAFLKDLETMLRILIAGAIGPSLTPRKAKPKIAKKSRTKPGDRK